jgi:hypothetical protein
MLNNVKWRKKNVFVAISFVCKVLLLVIIVARLFKLSIEKYKVMLIFLYLNCFALKKNNMRASFDFWKKWSRNKHIFLPSFNTVKPQIGWKWVNKERKIIAMADKEFKKIWGANKEFAPD